MTLFIDTTVGALLLGGFCAATLSGVFVVQTFLYVKLFPRDSVRAKAMVGAVLTLDVMHSLLVYTSIWVYLITNYGDEAKIDTIPIPLALASLVAAILRFIVHCFFSHRIHKLSRQRWRFTILILVLALLCLCCETVTTVGFIQTRTFTAFREKFSWVLTLGLGTSTMVDILITWFLSHFLHTLRREIEVLTSMDRVIGAVVLYTFVTNLLTSTATTLSMICWLTMPDNMVFMGIHFFIGKLYANSFLATLNARQQLQHQIHGGVSIDLSSRSSATPHVTPVRFLTHDEMPTPVKLEITVSRTIEFVVDEPSPPERARLVSTLPVHCRTL